MDVVAVDLGGTHVRFGVMNVGRGQVAATGDTVTLKVRDHVSFAAAWRHYGALAGVNLPRAAAIAVACPIHGKAIRLTNNPWVLDRDRL
ncbi:MAG: glucokinase, partial [Sphingomonadales bacterium]